MQGSFDPCSRDTRTAYWTNAIRRCIVHKRQGCSAQHEHPFLTGRRRRTRAVVLREWNCSKQSFASRKLLRICKTELHSRLDAAQLSQAQLSLSCQKPKARHAQTALRLSFHEHYKAGLSKRSTRSNSEQEKGEESHHGPTSA